MSKVRINKRKEYREQLRMFISMSNALRRRIRQLFKDYSELAENLYNDIGEIPQEYYDDFYNDTLNILNRNARDTIISVGNRQHRLRLTKQEENEFKLMKESIELMSLNEIKEDVEDTLQSFENFTIMDNVPKQETQETENITNDPSQLPQSNLVTPSVNPNLFAQGQTTNQGLTQTEQALLSPEEQQIRLRSRGLA